MTRQQVAALVAVLVVVAVVVVVKATGGKTGELAAREQALDAGSPGPAEQAGPPPDAEQPETPDTAAADAAAPGSSDAEGATSLPTLLELGSVGCKPCEYMEPIIEALTEELEGKVTVEFHDVAKRPEVAEKYQIMVIPTQIFLDAQGEELFRHTGVFEKEEILAKMKELGMLKE